jgi:futalosine hydrolase
MLLLVTAVDAEASVLEGIPDTVVVVGGIGRTNAASAVTEHILRSGVNAIHGVVSVGVGGVLSDSILKIGDVVWGEQSVYVEEGMDTQEGFVDIDGMGLTLGATRGNVMLPDEHLANACKALLPGVCIATVATCSGTDESAALVHARTGADVEAMEGAAVLHAAARLGVGAIEVRALSNTTGERASQRWELNAALTALGNTMPSLCKAMLAR